MPLVSTMGQLDDFELLKIAHNHQCALIAHGNLKENDFKTVQEQAKNLFQDMINILRPWEKQEGKNKYADIIEAFKQQFGDPDDPAVREKYEKNSKRVAEELQKANETEIENKKKIEEFERKLKENNMRRQRGNRK